MFYECFYGVAFLDNVVTLAGVIIIVVGDAVAGVINDVSVPVAVV